MQQYADRRHSSKPIIQSCNYKINKINKYAVNQKMFFMFIEMCALRAGGCTVFQIYFVLPNLRHHAVDTTLEYQK